ncbi:hypothetical protein LO772_21260 [Yinghuangia sp. ASG 101]|uniref:hypothetical protein n=1 Tax=Yinghuangia sp. ASG 101 TaxID=2896848 RepID=UPI001E3FF5A9|nr:hypothetical protein [Yinghuangia sp. ASG 101]UGQ09465.1 hypothetical protein LO772_21260 [Yinghuangia sp. ASG 101]
MLHLTDARTGRPQPAAPPGTRRLRVAYCPGSLRAALTADVVRRAAGRHHLVVDVTRHDCAAPGPADPLRFNIHPAHGTSGANDPAPDIHVTHDAEHVTPAPRILLVVPGDPEPTPAPAPAPETTEPLALRLALLAHGLTAAGPPAPDDVAHAAGRLAELRADVAHFAESPSAAPPVDRVAAVHAAIDDNLDTPRALTLTDALRTDPSLPAGARFEALAHLDRTLGLDLTHDIGR